jgi:Mn-dependent DtxR family transcriptional regulator
MNMKPELLRQLCFDTGRSDGAFRTIVSLSVTHPQDQHISGRTELGELLGVKPATAVKYVMELYRNGLVQIDEHGLAWLCSRQYEDFLSEYRLDLEDATRYDTTEAAK